MPLEGVRILLVTRDRPVHDRIRTLCSRIARELGTIPARPDDAQH